MRKTAKKKNGRVSFTLTIPDNIFTTLQKYSKNYGISHQDASRIAIARLLQNEGMIRK